TDQHPQPFHDGANTAMRGAAEIAAALFMAMQYLRQAREATDAARARAALDRTTRNEMIQRRQESARDRARAAGAKQWTHALDRGWMRTAAPDEVMFVWGASLKWTEEEVEARRAKRLAEERLDQLDPDLMRR